MQRRRFLEVGKLGLASYAIAGPARWARAEISRGAPVAIVDANLVGFETPDGTLSKKVRTALRTSGVTLVKISLDGRGEYSSSLSDIGQARRTVALNPDLLMLVYSGKDLQRAKDDGLIGVVLSFEAVEMLDGRLVRISQLYDQGVRVMQLSYNSGSVFSSGVMSPAPSSGLTSLGHKAVRTMNALGMTLDISHSDEKAVFDVVKASSCPVVATHTGCASIYAHPRNKSDAALKAIAETGGVVGIYMLPFLAPGPEQPTSEDYMAHLLHALDICGEDHVGIGSDNTIYSFTETGKTVRSWKDDINKRKALGIAAPDEDRFPFVRGLNGPDRYHTIAELLEKRGIKYNVVVKILGLNFERVFRETWL